MVTLNLAYTAPINPPSAAPVLTQAQVWAGLQRKVRHAEEFVPVIVECRVVNEEDGGKKVTREVRFREGAGPKDVVREVCVEHEPARIDFVQPSGTVISNIISDGPGGGDGDLQMTYCFEYAHPEVEEGSEEAKKVFENHKKTAKMAVEKSIDTIRRLVQEGQIQ